MVMSLKECLSICVDKETIVGYTLDLNTLPATLHECYQFFNPHHTQERLTPLNAHTSSVA